MGVSWRDGTVERQITAYRNSEQRSDASYVNENGHAGFLRFRGFSGCACVVYLRFLSSVTTVRTGL